MVLTCVGMPLLVAGQPVKWPDNLLVSHDGAYVISVPNRMAWARCVEGMQWNGKTCSGRAQRMTQPQAQARAAERAAQEKLPWRLPTVLELQRIVNRKAQPPGPDLRLFPASPLEPHWTSTLLVKNTHINVYDYDNVMQGQTENRSGAEIDFANGWAVDLSSGNAVKGVAKSELLAVRLLWTIDPVK